MLVSKFNPGYSGLFLITIVSMLIYAGCSMGPNKERVAFEIDQLEADLTRSYNQTGRSEATLATSAKLRDAYIRYADTWKSDSLAAEYLFQAAMIDADIREDVTNGLHYLERIASEYPDHPIHSKTLFLIGFTYAEQLSQFDKAREAYEKYLQLYPDGEMAPSVRIELDNLGIRPSFLPDTDSTSVVPPQD
jgi:tetratricopeptide (TPR) repeat protein